MEEWAVYPREEADQIEFMKEHRSEWRRSLKKMHTVAYRGTIGFTHGAMCSGSSRGSVTSPANRSQTQGNRGKEEGGMTMIESRVQSAKLKLA